MIKLLEIVRVLAVAFFAIMETILVVASVIKVRWYLLIVAAMCAVIGMCSVSFLDEIIDALSKEGSRNPPGYGEI